MVNFLFKLNMISSDFSLFSEDVILICDFRTHGTLLVGDAWGRVYSWSCES